MFDMEDSDSSIDDETLAWIDQYPELELDAPTFNYLRGGAVASVPTSITGEDDVAEHAKDTLSKILGMCSREEVESIGNVNDAKTLISQKQLILEQAERLGRGQDEERRRSERNRAQQGMAAYRANMSEQERAQANEARANMSEERRRSERIRIQRCMATYRATMSEQQRAQANEANRLRMATARANMSDEERSSVNQSTRMRMARLRSQRILARL